jgi:hypothetical protein
MAMVHESVVAERVPVVIYTPQLWVRGLVELRGTTRLTDLLNQPAFSVLTVHEGELLPVGGRQWPEARRLVLNKTEILFAHPVRDPEQTHSAAGLQLPKVPVVVTVHVDAYAISGMLHLPDRLLWEQYLSTLRDRFLPITDATITRAVDGAPVATARYVAINRERLSALFEL